MNSRGQIGQIFTSFPSIIIVFVIMLLFVIISGFISSNARDQQNIARDFAKSYISFNNEIITVKEAIEKNCYSGHTATGFYFNESLGDIIVRAFLKRYGYGSSLVLSNPYVHSGIIIEGRYLLYLRIGAFDNLKIDEEWPVVSKSEFEKVFNPKLKNYDYFGFCGDDRAGFFMTRGEP